MSEQSSIARERLVFRPQSGPAGDVLVTVLLRGGIDGLYAFPPLADPDYAKECAAFDATAPHLSEPVKLDDFFGMRYTLFPLWELYERGHLAVVHACGPTERLLSHFDAMRLLEQGSHDGPKDGWLGRHLSAQTGASSSPLRAIALGSAVPLVLRGVAGVRVLNSLEDLRLELPTDWKPGFMTALARLYASGSGPLAAAGRGTLATLAAVDRLSTHVDPPKAPPGVEPSALWKQLELVSRLIKAEVGLEAAVLTQGGWDTHLSQVKEIHWPMHDLAWALRVFADNLGNTIDRVTVVVISEFGRRVAPNGAGGTDHGRGSVALVLGGGIRGGKVYSRWPGLAEALDADGNLPVTTDFRDVLAEIVDRRLRNPHLDHVFPRLPAELSGSDRGLSPRAPSGGASSSTCPVAERQADRVGPAVPGDRLGHDSGSVAHVAATVEHRIAVEDFLVPAEFGHAQAISAPDDRREVAAHDDEVARVFCPAEVTQGTVLIVVAIDPLEARRIEVDLVSAGSRR